MDRTWRLLWKRLWKLSCRSSTTLSQEIENTSIKLAPGADWLSLPSVPAPGMRVTFAQVCSSRVTKEYRLSRTPLRIFVNPGVPITARRAFHLPSLPAQIGLPRGVDASFHEVYSELAVAEAASAAPPPPRAHESS